MYGIMSVHPSGRRTDMIEPTGTNNALVEQLQQLGRQFQMWEAQEDRFEMQRCIRDIDAVLFLVIIGRTYPLAEPRTIEDIRESETGEPVSISGAMLEAHRSGMRERYR